MAAAESLGVGGAAAQSAAAALAQNGHTLAVVEATTGGLITAGHAGRQAVPGASMPTRAEWAFNGW